VFCPDSPKTEGQALARHRSPGGRQQSWDLDEERYVSLPRTQDKISKPTSRIASPSSAVRGRVVVAAVALGAFAAAAAGQALQGPRQAANELPPLDGGDASALMGLGGTGPAAAPDVLTVARTTDASAEAQKMAESGRLNQALAANLAQQQQEAARGKFVRPAVGTFTSGFGYRWGAAHNGCDIANRIGTPILAVTDGVVVEAGPASGFGLWVRIQHADGTISVYGHVDTFSVREGQ
jgi:murein DD-endopeptidase MepM/ murein hydrolase activator NlpD